ncbi:MAG: hypothetical protein K8R88_07720 [Armatimonadetes bacterium]|nr:hypothetical protein [Armatimonadota bacterium]
MSKPPKYSQLEIERRWLVDRAAVGSLEGLPWREIEDFYLRGTRLRLRKICAPGADPVYKLCKKYGKADGLEESITNLYLSLTEYNVLRALGGARVLKKRYSFSGGSLDVHESPSYGTTIFEVEFKTLKEAEAFLPPDFVGEEVTGNTRYSGASLADLPVQQKEHNSVSPFAEEILQNAAELRRLHDQICESFATGEHALSHAEACKEFHARYDELAFPGGWETAYARIAAEDPEALEAALAWVECKPFFFRSGYKWDTLMRKLRHAPFDEGQRARFEVVHERLLEFRSKRASTRNE